MVVRPCAAGPSVTVSVQDADTTAGQPVAYGLRGCHNMVGDRYQVLL
jgi:hypothetical protein